MYRTLRTGWAFRIVTGCRCPGRRLNGVRQLLVELDRIRQLHLVAARATTRTHRLLANQSRHLPTPLEARPPDRVVRGGIALQAKRGIVREQRTHRFDTATAEHRPVGPSDRA